MSRALDVRVISKPVTGLAKTLQRKRAVLVFVALLLVALFSSVLRVPVRWGGLEL